ncbi:MAG: hypothetical protein ACTSX9_09525 [Candidatus Njordarchaeales archaeon]
MPRIRITFYAEALIPWNIAKKLKSEEINKMALEFRNIIFRHGLVEKCLNKLRKLGLVGEWLRELWFFELSEERLDSAYGVSKEKKGLNVWFFQWVYAAAPTEVIDMEDKIKRETTIREKIRINNLEMLVESYITVAEED